MFLIAPLLVGLILVGWYLWWRNQDRLVARSHAASGDVEAGIPPDLARWMEAGLLSSEQIDAIVSFERARTPHRRIPLIAEAMGYIGAILALAGGGVAIGQVWEDWTEMQHVAIIGAAAATALLGGWLLRSQTEPALQRMMSVLWAFSVGGAAGTAALFYGEILEVPELMRALTIGGTAAVYAAVLWLLHRHALQEAALFVAGLVTSIGIVLALVEEPAPQWGFALVVWAYGLTWMVLGWKQLVQPAWTAMGLGSMVWAFGPSIGSEHGWMLGLGLLTAAAFMTLGVTTRRLPLLGIGSVALFAYLTALVVRYFGDALGVPAALAIVGIVVLGLAVLLGRSGTFGEHRQAGGAMA